MSRVSAKRRPTLRELQLSQATISRLAVPSPYCGKRGCHVNAWRSEHARPGHKGPPRLCSEERCAARARRSGANDRAIISVSSPLMTPDGVWMIVEPMAHDDFKDNLNPVGRVYYGASTFICTPASLSQEVALGLGAQAGERRLRQVVTEAGFTKFRRATETPFNMILEARP